MLDVMKGPSSHHSHSGVVGSLELHVEFSLFLPASVTSINHETLTTDAHRPAHHGWDGLMSADNMTETWPR